MLVSVPAVVDGRDVGGVEDGVVDADVVQVDIGVVADIRIVTRVARVVTGSEY